MADVSKVYGNYSLVVHRREVERTVSTVDVADELGNKALELGRLGQSGGGDLDKDDLAAPLGVGKEELLESLELDSQNGSAVTRAPTLL